MTNIEVIKELYRTFREKDYDAFARICTSDVEWIQNEGFPRGAVRKGAGSVVEGVFKTFNDDWKTFSYEIDEFLEAGNTIVVVGAYTGYHRVSGKSLRATAAHIYDLRGGKVFRFRMFADTKTIWDAMA